MCHIFAASIVIIVRYALVVLLNITSDVIRAQAALTFPLLVIRAFVSQKSIVDWVATTQILSVLCRKNRHIQIYILKRMFFFCLFSLHFFFLFTLLWFTMCKAMMIVDLIQNTTRKSTIYLTSIIFSFFFEDIFFWKTKNFSTI